MKSDKIKVISILILMITIGLFVRVREYKNIDINEMKNAIGGCGAGYHLNSICFLQQPGCRQALCWGAGEYHACGSEYHQGWSCTQTDNVTVVCTCLKGVEPLSIGGAPLHFEVGVVFDYIKGPDCFS